jgi:hypothetical protein
MNEPSNRTIRVVSKPMDALAKPIAGCLEIRGESVANTLAASKRISYRRVNVRWMTPLGDETASMS